MTRESRFRVHCASPSPSASDPHRAELVESERTAIHAHPHLGEEHRATVLAFDQPGDDREEPRCHQQKQRRAENVEGAFDDLIPPLERDLGEIDQRQPIEILDTGTHDVVLKNVGHDLDIDQQLTGPPHELHRPVVGRQRQGDHHLIDPFIGDDLFQVAGGAEHRHALNVPLLPAGIVIEKADDRKAVLPVQLQTLDNLSSEIAGTDHQHPLEIAARASDSSEGDSDDPTSETHQDRVDAGEDRQEESRVGEVRWPVEGQARRQEHGRQEHRDHHPQRLVETRPDPAPLIQTLEVEDQRIQHHHHRHQTQVHVESAACPW